MPSKFILLMLLAVALATLIPAIGRPDGPLHLGQVTKIGIGLIFFLHGAKLSRQNLVVGAKLWKVHALIQSTTFIAFPILGAIVYLLTAGILPDPLRLGFFFLGALSSTISSSVALTSIANGNVSVAVFNATLSGLIGLFLTPVFIALVTTTTGADFALSDAIMDILVMLLLPFMCGQFARPLIGEIVERHTQYVSMFDRAVILLIIFTSFSSAMYEGVFSSFSVPSLTITLGLVLLILVLGLSYITYMSRRLNLPNADKSAAVFCGATKSLSNGAPIAQILFFGSPDLAMIMLPILLYHQIQLIVCAHFAQKFATL